MPGKYIGIMLKSFIFCLGNGCTRWKNNYITTKGDLIMVSFTNSSWKMENNVDFIADGSFITCSVSLA